MTKPRFKHLPAKMIATTKTKNASGAIGQVNNWPLSNAVSLPIICIVAVLTRLWYTFGQSVTYDEFYELQLSKQTLTHIAFRGDGFPPLYSAIMHYWQGMFGSHAGIGSARALSIMLGVACIPAIFFTAKRAACEKAGLIAAGLLAILPIHMFYTSEARAYSLLLLITCLATHAALHAIESRTIASWMLFALLATAGIYTHYLFACFVGIVLLVGLIQGRDGITVLTGAAILLLTTPLIFMWSNADFNMQQGWTYQIPFGLGELCYTYGAFFLGYTAGPSTRELHPMPFVQAVISIAPWATLVIGAGMGLLLTARRRIPSNSATPLLLSLLLSPALTGMACMTFSVGYQVRYVVWTIIPALVFLSYLIVEALPYRFGKYSIGKYCVAILVLVMLAAGFNRSAWDRYRNEDVRAAAEFLQDDPALKRPIIVVSGYMVEPFKYYLDASWKLAGIPMNFKFDERATEFEQVLTENVKPHEVVWFVYTREFHEDPDGILFRKMEEVADLKLVKTLAGLKVYRATIKTSGT